MRQAFSAETEATPDELLAVMSDLGSYPHWLDVVDAAEVVDGQPAAWLVTLKARVGPFARSKRLRMVRTENSGTTVRFERAELDGKDHSNWVLQAVVDKAEQSEPSDDPPMASRVELSLSYDGTMWSGILDGVLGAAAQRATKKLQAYVQL